MSKNKIIIGIFVFFVLIGIIGAISANMSGSRTSTHTGTYEAEPQTTIITNPEDMMPKESDFPKELAMKFIEFGSRQSFSLEVPGKDNAVVMKLVGRYDGMVTMEFRIYKYDTVENAILFFKKGNNEDCVAPSEFRFSACEQISVQSSECYKLWEDTTGSGDYKELVARCRKANIIYDTAVRGTWTGEFEEYLLPMTNIMASEIN